MIDEKMKEALLKRAYGFEVEEKKIILDKSGKETKRIEMIKKYIPPDPGAVKTIMRLKNMNEW